MLIWNRWGYLAVVLVLILSLALCLPGRQGVRQVSQPAEAGIQLPIIMYHGVLEKPDAWGTYVISVSELESDLQQIQKAGYHTVTIEELIDYVYDGAPLPEKPILLTFDDGYYNNYLYVYPLLQKYDMKAVLSIIGKYTDLYSVSREENPVYSHVTWRQVREMAESGLVEIQNHSYNLHTIDKTRSASMKVSGETLGHYTTTLVADAIRLQRLIDEQIQQLPQAYTYPYGLVSEESIPILREAGFRCTLCCMAGMNTITRDPGCLVLMKRLLRPHGTGVAELLQKYDK